MKFELPRGMRDLEPDEYRMIEFVKQKFIEVTGLFGFNLMEPSPIESLSTLEAKSGPAISNEIYGFRDKAGRDIALRFDLTMGLTRFVSSRRDLRLPIKLASFGSMFRYDEPQMGRYRWFHQWDIEIYDSFNIESDAEIIEFTSMYLQSLGIDTQIEICDRQLLEDYLRTHLKVMEENKILELLRAVDKVPKKGAKAVMEEYSGKGFEFNVLEQLLSLSTLRGDMEKVLSDERIRNLTTVSKVQSLMNSLNARGIRNIAMNMGIVRGLDYYSGVVFEAFDRSNTSGALVGGGRYDTLPAAFGRDDIGATGAAGGIERIVCSLLKRNFKATQASTHSVFVAYVNEDLKKQATGIVSLLRRKGIVSELDFEGRPLKKQLEEASKKKYQFTIILAPEELSNNEVILRDMESGGESKIKLDDFKQDPVAFVKS